jgi:hypothetical protein
MTVLCLNAAVDGLRSKCVSQISLCFYREA